MPKIAPPLLIVLLCGVCPNAVLADDSRPPTTLQFSIDAVTRADNCLYMLQSTRDPASEDCKALRDFHERSFLAWTPDLEALDANTRRRVERNRQMYLQTLDDIERESKQLD